MNSSRQNEEHEINIPQVKYQGEDKKLQEQIVKYNKGTRRIIVFTLVGLLMGWLSYSYVNDGFIVTKVILAVPYKINEMLHLALHGNHPAWYPGRGFPDAFFPQVALASFLAERITPVLLGGAIYGSLAYFSGDKRIFTLSGYLKFACAWAASIVFFISLVFALNTYGVQKNNSLSDVSGFCLSSESTGCAFYEEDTQEVREKIYEALESAFYNGLVRDDSIARDQEKEVDTGLYFGNPLGGYMQARVNYEQRYIVTDRGYIYRISEEYAGLVKEYYESDSILGERFVY